MAAGKPIQARCRQGRVIIADERVHVMSFHGLSRRPRWTVARAQVRDLMPLSGHGVTINLTIVRQDGRELRLDWLLPHDALRVAAALGYEWTIARMREMAAVRTLGEAAAFALAPDDEPTLERPRVVVRPAVITVPLADTPPADAAPRATRVSRPTSRLTSPLATLKPRLARVTPPLATVAAVASTQATVALVHARAGLASARARAHTMARRPQMATLAAWLMSLTAWLGVQARRLRSWRPPRPASPSMKLLYLALLVSLIAISSAGWLWAGGGSSSHHSARPPSRLIQVYGGVPPVIVTTPTPTPTISPTEPPIVAPTPVPQPTATPLPQPTPTPTPLPATLTVAITCAQAQAFVQGQICVHTQPFAALALTITYCGGTGQSPATFTPQARVRADANGNYTWTFVPKTRCVGPAQATVTANWQGQTATTSTTFIVKP